MVSCHRGMNLSTVVFSDSVRGRSSGLLLAYRLSLPGNLGSFLPPSNSALTNLVTEDPGCTTFRIAGETFTCETGVLRMHYIHPPELWGLVQWLQMTE